MHFQPLLEILYKTEEQFLFLLPNESKGPLGTAKVGIAGRSELMVALCACA
jgi:hypothetical protein